MIWPFDHAVLALYLATLALHAVFVSYVVGGTAYALVQAARGRGDDVLADQVRDRLPFMLGCGITAGVAPLLFVQLMHQQRFYTANLLMGPRWVAVVPVLIVGFYALYLAKHGERFRRAALGVALACFVFVAWSWSELHELMAADTRWHAFYAAGHRLFRGGMIAPRLVVLLGAMATLFATVAAWSAPDARKRLARIALGGRALSVLGALWLWRAGFPVEGGARAWFVVLTVATCVEVGAWLAVMRGQLMALGVATAAGASALVAAVVVREAPRIALIEPARPLADAAGGWLVFGIALVAGVAAIAWIWRTVR
jgi:hypothetical protein